MKAELVKREDRYDLYALNGHKMASTAPNTMNKLSKKNCDLIATDGISTFVEVEVEIQEKTGTDLNWIGFKLDEKGCLILKKYNHVLP